MSDITSQSLTSLVKNIKNRKLSSQEITKAFVTSSEDIFFPLILSTNDVNDREVIFDIIQQPLELQKSLHYLQANFL